MRPVEPRLEESNPDAAVFDLVQSTQVVSFKLPCDVAVKTRQNAVAMMAPVHNTSCH